MSFRTCKALDLRRAALPVVLGLVALGSRYKEIARTLFVSESTINREMRKVYDGLGVKDAAHAVSEAWRRGFL